MKTSLCLPILTLALLSCSQDKTATNAQPLCRHFPCEAGAIVRGDTTQKKLTLVFTGDEFADGGEHIRAVLDAHSVKGAFFFTGNFYRNPAFAALIRKLKADGHYLGAHSDKHLLYCTWENRDSLLVSKGEFVADLEANYREMGRFGISKKDAPYFLPPYEWYNDSISQWTVEQGLQLINLSRGTRSHADYTTPDLKNYHSSEAIYNSILNFEGGSSTGLNGFLLLSHIGTAPERQDKFYLRLGDLILTLKERGYEFVPLDDLLRR